jgi:hypothetical protein
MTKSLYLLAIILAAVAVSFSAGFSLYLFSSPPCVMPTDVLSDFDRQGLSVYTDMNKFLISVTLVIAGLAGGLVLSVAKERFTLSSWSIYLLFLAFSLSIISLYFGYVSYSSVFDAMINRCVDLSGQRLKLPQMVQYYAMLAAFLAGIGVVVVQVVKNRQPEEDS